MILLDNRSGDNRRRDTSKELQVYIQRIGVKAELDRLEFGDAAFEGNGPEGRVMIGVERKTISDMINCIEDARYSAHQLPGMAKMYAKSILMVEGIWKPDIGTGYLMELVNTLNWRPFRYRARMERYHMLFRYLLSVSFGGVTVIQSRDLEQTAYNICEIYHYFQKPWEQHTALLGMQKLNIPTLNGRPSLVQRVAAELDGVGVKLSAEAAKVFKSTHELVSADESEWMQIPGIGVKLARDIVAKIRGYR